MIDLGSLDDFPERSVRIVSIEGRQVGVVRWRGEEVYAVHNRCAHMGGPVCRGSFGPKIVSRGGVPGTLEVDDDVPVLICSWHRWEFEAATGRSVLPSDYRLRTYPVKIENGRVLLGMRLPRKRSRVMPDPAAASGS